MGGVSSELCSICRKKFSHHSLFPFSLVKEQLQGLILKDHPNLKVTSSICRDDIAEYFKRWVQVCVAKHKKAHLNYQKSIQEKLTDKLAKYAGSWHFILLFCIVVFVWISINSIQMFARIQFDPHPYILLNLMLSCLAAIQAPIIIMSQNKESERDRAQMLYDFEVNLRAEKEIKDLHKKLDRLSKKF